jgi:alpha-mannosidase
VTWVTEDAPLAEIGGLTANLPRSQPNPNAYMKTIQASSKIYAWAMNNHWHTNYRADQEGPTWFRFALRPHRAYDPVAAMRFGVESTEPLIVVPASGAAPAASPLRIEPDSVIATAFKPADDGKALVVRLFGASAKTQKAKLTWATAPKEVWLSDASERPLKKASGKIEVPGWGLTTLRADLP